MMINHMIMCNVRAVELGKQLGIPTPYNEVLTAVIRQREADF